jgi:RNA polymerase sigma factor (sigma-70 family)
MTDEAPSLKNDDEAIALALMYGEEDGLRQLLDLHGGKVIALLRKKFIPVLTQEDIEEVFNDAVHKVFKFINQYDVQKGTLCSWFYRIAANTAVDLYRKENKHQHEYIDHEVVNIVDENWQPDCLREKPMQNQKATRRQKEIFGIIETLPELQKNIIKADVVCRGPASASDLAKKYGSSKSSIYTSRNKAIETIRREMAKLGYSLDEEDSK